MDEKSSAKPKSTKKLVAVCVTLFLVLFFILSGSYVAQNVEHDCVHNETCSICITVNSCKKLIDSLATSGSLWTAAAFVYLLVLCILACAWLFAASTPTNLKIRLNN